MEIKAQAIYYYGPLRMGHLMFLLTFNLHRDEQGALVWRLMQIDRDEETRVSHFRKTMSKDILYLGAYRNPELVRQIVDREVKKIARNFPFSDKVFRLALQGKLTWWQTLKHQYIRVMGY